MSDVKKKVDESWKQQIEQERGTEPPTASSPSSAAPEAQSPREERLEEAADGMPEARFDLFLSGLAVDALIALGDMPHPTTRKPAQNLAHARYLIDLLGILEEKTKGNLTADEARLMKDTLYQLRMRYLAKTTPQG